MKKVMISVAPVAATDPLINPRAIARDVIECWKNGAAMVHLHVRDLCGRLSGVDRERARRAVEGHPLGVQFPDHLFAVGLLQQGTGTVPLQPLL